MGIVKAWMMEMEERGYGESDDLICGACVADEFLKNWVADNATANACSFCGAKAKSPIAASFEDFTGIVLGGVGFDWNEPTDEGIMYISAEGGWQAPMTTTSEVLYDTGFTVNGDVVAALVDMIDNEAWVEREFYCGTDSQRLTWGWDILARQRELEVLLQDRVPILLDTNFWVMAREAAFGEHDDPELISLLGALRMAVGSGIHYATRLERRAAKAPAIVAASPAISAICLATSSNCSWVRGPWPSTASVAASSNLAVSSANAREICSRRCSCSASSVIVHLSLPTKPQVMRQVDPQLFLGSAEVRRPSHFPFDFVATSTIGRGASRSETRRPGGATPPDRA